MLRHTSLHMHVLRFNFQFSNVHMILYAEMDIARRDDVMLMQLLT